MILEIFQWALSPGATEALKRPLSFEEKLFYSFLRHWTLATDLQMHIARVGVGFLVCVWGVLCFL